MTTYLDASVIVPIISKENTSSLVDRFIDTLDERPVVSALGIGETYSAISRLVQMRITPLDIAWNRLSSLDEWLETSAQRIDTEAEDIRLAGTFVRRVTLNLRMPDAIHMATVARLRLTLATLDRRLADAARSLDLRVIVPE